jgi:hypothetical protein
MFRFLHVIGDHVEDHLELCLVQASHHHLNSANPKSGMLPPNDGDAVCRALRAADLPREVGALLPLTQFPPLLRLVNRAFPRPVPIVSTPQRSTSRMNGISLKPCTTASLCSTIDVS